MAHSYPIKVRFYELDPYNHLNHAAYIQYFEVGRVEFLESIGFQLNHLQDLGYHLVVTEIKTRFLRSAGAHDELVVETEIGEIRRATATWHQRLVRGEEIVAQQEISFAVTDTDGKPVRFPDQLVAALSPHTAPQG